MVEVDKTYESLYVSPVLWGGPIVDSGNCEGDQSRALQEIPQFKLCYKIRYNSPPGDSSEN